MVRQTHDPHDRVSSSKCSQKRGSSLSLSILLTAAIILFCAGLAVIAFIVIRFSFNDSSLSSEASKAQSAVASWPTSQQKKQLTKAQKYNQQLAQLAQRHAQPIGAQSDPFPTGKKSDASSQLSKALQNDPLHREYMQALNLDVGGIMGTIKIPEISVKLPIYHGTSDEDLDRGVGHIEGTSLPVGGPSTHTVIAGHRGLPNAMMFTRVDELRKGDPIYITSIGRTLAYKVDRIRVVGPDDTSLLRIVPGEDRITLYTCTPYGVNTMRLLVSGVRAHYPQEVPDVQDAGPDWHKIFGSLALFALLLLLLTFFIAMATRRTITMQHGPIGKHARKTGSIRKIMRVRQTVDDKQIADQ